MIHTLSYRLQKPFQQESRDTFVEKGLLEENTQSSKYKSVGEGCSESDTHNDNGLSFWQGACIVINLIMGCGFLGLPKLIEAAGVILGPIVLILACFVLIITTTFEAEIMCRAEAVFKARIQPSSVQEIKMDPKNAMRIRRAFPMVEMCELFGGRFLRNMYAGLVSVQLMSAMLAYTTVFATTMSHHFAVPFIFEGKTCTSNPDAKGCHQLHSFYIGVYALIVIPLSLRGVKEQVSFQVVMTFFRYCVVFIMAGTCAYGLSSDSQVFDASVRKTQGVRLFCVAQLFQLLFPAIFAQTGNAFVSVVVRDLNNKDAIGKVLATGMLMTCTMYCIIAITLAFYLGDSIPQTANVIWEHYTGGESVSVWWVQFIVTFVLTFPAFDVLSVFPLFTIGMASNVIATCYNTSTVHAERDRFVVRFFRLLCAAPPIAIALLVGENLDRVLMFCGSCTIPVAMLIPPYLNYLSQKAIETELGIECSKTILSSMFSQPKVLFTIFVVGSLLLCASLILNVQAAL